MAREDIVIIGGGPAGSVAASRLLAHGRRPLIVEREDFPRFHVGESLVPASQGVWHQMGLEDVFQHSGHEFKYASRVMIADDEPGGGVTSMTVQFSKVPYKEMPLRPFAYQVERAVFDKQLLDTAIGRGARVLKASVSKVLFDGDRAAGVTVRTADGGEAEILADFVLDASGRSAVIANQLGIRRYDPVIQTSACFGHFDNVTRESGQGYFEAYLIENGWLWLIPLSGNRMSVGLVQNRPQADAWGSDGEAVLLDAVNRYPWLRQRFAGATQLSRIRMLRRLAYHSPRMAGDGWLAIGDAFFFIDPLFSTGVHIAMKTGQSSADAIHEYLSTGRDRRVLARLEQDYIAYRDLTVAFVRSVYGLMRHRLSARLAVTVCGPLSRDLDTWLLRRLTYWLSGHYESHARVMRTIVFFNRLLTAGATALHRLTGLGGWRPVAAGDALRIPKAFTDPRPGYEVTS